MREEEKIFAGQLFSPGHSDLVAIKTRSHKLSAAYGQIDEGDKEARTALAKIMLAEYGEGSSMTGPVFFHYGKHTCIGKRVFINYNFTVQDDAPVVIGDDCNFGPNCTIVTPIHPMLPQERLEMYDENGEKKHMCYAKPVTIGHDCWFGANVCICPGVIIGNNCVIGAGSVVTRDIPDNSFAAGVPCRVIREITEKDSMKYKPEVLGDNRVIE
ncbi:MAG: sugar O-acetyltransferase [Eubacteriales bacterium]|nr:sugar O-acetyltransferase [Eubacteriales bacterium]